MVQGSLSKDDVEMKAALHNDHEVRVRLDGENLLLPKEAIDPSKVELECDDHLGCYLVPDDGNPHNDIVQDNHQIDPLQIATDLQNGTGKLQFPSGGSIQQQPPLAPFDPTASYHGITDYPGYDQPN